MRGKKSEFLWCSLKGMCADGRASMPSHF